MLADTHTHIHDHEVFAQDEEQTREILTRSAENNVRELALIGTSLSDSIDAVNFAKKWTDFAKSLGIKFVVALGIHPHEADPKLARNLESDVKDLRNLLPQTLKDGEVKVAAIGEIGLDYFYDFEFRERQMKLLKLQLELALKFNLPVNFHIRDFKKPNTKNSVWKDFWRVFDDENFAKFGYEIPIIFHSYTEQSRENLAKILELPNVYFGVNGISTFAKSSEEDLWKNAIPLEKMVLETDAPFLAPKGFRGTKNEPARILDIAKNLAEFREKTLPEISRITTKNAELIYRF